MRPSQKYRSVSRNSTAPSTPNRDTCIPLTSLTPVNMSGYAGRRGKARQQVGMWGILSPYYSNGVTIDNRWSSTVSNREA